MKLCLAIASLILSSIPAHAAPQEPAPSQDDSLKGVIRRIEFVGLRRVSPITLRASISSREGQPLDPAQVERDVRALDNLGWFDSVSAEVELLPVLLAEKRDAPQPFADTRRTGPAISDAVPSQAAPILRLAFVLQERPFLARLDFRGSHALEREQIESLLAAKGLAPRLAHPYNPTALWRVRRAIEMALADKGYARAHVTVHMQEQSGSAVRAVFRIEDGPRVRVSGVSFIGNNAFPEKTLLKEMQRIAPQAFLAGVRDKTVFTPERLDHDRQRIEQFYRNHGYPEVRLGDPRIDVSTERVRHWLPWPRTKIEPRFQISLPIQEGILYRLETVQLEGPGLEKYDGLPESLPHFEPLEPYSQEKLFRARDAVLRLPVWKDRTGGLRPDVEIIHRFNPERGTVRVVLRAHAPQVFIIRRIEFAGHHRFTDRFYRRHIELREGEPFDPAKLEKGLAQLAATGFIRPLTKEDVKFVFDDQAGVVDILIRVEEIGRQRVSLSGTAGTIGMAYNVFSLLGREEMLTGYLEGGPQVLTIASRLAREGLFGNRASLGLSVYQNLVRPRMPGQHQPLFTSRGTGLSLGGNFAASRNDSLGLTYEYTRTSTEQNLSLPPEIAAVIGSTVRSHGSRSAIALAWSHQESGERLSASTTFSGGPFGGSEDVLGASAEYALIHSDSLSGARNAWAFRAHVSGVTSHSGGSLPLHARLFAGSELVRGLRGAELSPYVVVTNTNADGTTAHIMQATGATLVTSANAEYQIPFSPTISNAEAALFFDAGAGWLLPGWLGAAALPSTSTPSLQTSVVRASTGVEIRWLVPGVRQTLRVHYAANPLQLAQALLLPDGSRFRPSQRRSAVGWALGSFF